MGEELGWVLGLSREQTDKLPALLQFTFLWEEMGGTIAMEERPVLTEPQGLEAYHWS